MPLKTRIDIVGRKFGKLQVLEYSHTQNSKAFWRCLCDCGNLKTTDYGSLKYGNVKSCGCLKSDARKGKYGMSAFRFVLYSYKRNAKIRSLDFLISDDEFLRLSLLNCFYCGASPSNIQRGKRLFGEYKYNGIDRLDNNKGYIEGNVVPCCGICNKAKRDLSYDDFISWVNRLSDNMMSKKISFAS